MSATATDPIDRLAERLQGVKPTARGITALCPAHADHKQSLDVDRGDDGRALMTCRAGCSTSDVLAAIGLEPRDLFADTQTNPARVNGTPRRKRERAPIVARYPYVDPSGALLFEVCRTADKSFPQRRPLPGGGYAWNLDGIDKRPLYRLPELREAPKGSFIFDTEGEKDADKLRANGLIATTTSGGAAKSGAPKWRHTDLSPLYGHDVVLLPDNDDAGRAHMATLAAELHGKAASVRVLTLPDLPGKGDVSDWLDAGGDVEDLVRMAEACPVWTPPAAPEPDEPGEPEPDAEPQAAPILDPRDPMPSARELVAAKFTAGERRIIHHHRGEFTAWARSHYAALTDDEVRAAAYKFAEQAVTITTGKDGEAQQRPFKPNRAKVGDIIDALRAVALLPGTIDAPAWLTDREGDPDPAEIVALRNGLYHLPTGRLLPHTPRLFNRHALPFDFDADAGEPTAWLRFLADLWPNDAEAIRALRQWFGYVLTTDTRQQKIMLLVGPKRSGKGTAARVLSAMVGRENVAGPTLASLSHNFGLAPLVDKPLAIIADARLSGRADQATIAERLLSVSGEDGVTVDRKHREAWTGKLPTRFLILTNELPRLADASGALASRFVVLTLARSFYGREDHHLTDRLLAELPAIFRWAVEGWRDLQAAGRFITPASSAEAVAELEDLGSPVGAFIRERCIVEPGRSVQTADLFRAWRDWCESQGRDHPGTVQTFGRDVRAAVPGLSSTQPRIGGTRLRFWEGIDLDG